MVMCEQDPDILQWGLHHLLGDLSISDYCGTDAQNNANIHDGEHVRDSDFTTDHAAMENDKVIAHALQKEFSQVAVAEASGHSPADEELFQASVLAQDWFGPSMGNLYPDIHLGSEGHHDMSDDMEPSASCSTLGEKLYEGEVFRIELTDGFSSLDGEVGKRLNNMVPVPHVPKINGEIPSVDEAISDHQRLLDRLRLYDLVELKVQGDGNCQFRALSDQFYRTPEHHKFVRQQVVNQLKSHPEMYEGYVPMAYGDYLKKMSKSGEWGDHVTLQAAADKYGVKIFVLTSFKDTCYIEILPNVQKSKRGVFEDRIARNILVTLHEKKKDTSSSVIFLSFWAEVHYNSIYPKGDFPILAARKKKRWWHFGK